MKLAHGPTESGHHLVVTSEVISWPDIPSSTKGLTMRYGFTHSPFGEVMVAWTSRGICHLAFCEAPQMSMTQALCADWPQAQFALDNEHAQRLGAQVFALEDSPRSFHVALRGTAFQVKVWQALLQLERGQVISYQQLAQRIGAPQAQRAVGTALAANTIGVLVPCHRVVRAGGQVGNYRWGAARKQALLSWEAAKVG